MYEHEREKFSNNFKETKLRTFYLLEKLLQDCFTTACGHQILNLLSGQCDLLRASWREDVERVIYDNHVVAEVNNGQHWR